MRQFALPIILLLAALSLGGCSNLFVVTRTETDLYTITERDTTIRQDVKNAPGDRDNGTIYPSPRTVEISRQYIQRDSTVNRYYPAFLRFGLIEAASFIAPGQSDAGSGRGLFGLYDLLSLKFTDSSKVLGAYMYRILPYELWLRVFRDDPNWTIGTAAYENFIRQSDSSADIGPGESLDAVLPLYVRRRFYFREKPPYIMAQPFLGIGLFPSAYVNLGATFDIGSYGGLNFRAYAGFITGTAYTQPDTITRERRVGPFIVQERVGVDNSLTTPYFGVGVSAIDFVNRVPELFVEWKDHKHSAIEVSALNLDLVYSSSQKGGRFLNPSQNDSSAVAYPSGMLLHFGSANLPILPLADGNFFVGTSLFNGMLFSTQEIAFGWLPLRAGYRMDLMESNLNLVGAAEYTYYPSSALTIGARLALTIADFSPYGKLQLNAVAGYATGSLGFDVDQDIKDQFNIDDSQLDTSFSTFYFGVGIGIGDLFNTLARVMKD